MVLGTVTSDHAADQDDTDRDVTRTADQDDTDRDVTRTAHEMVLDCEEQAGVRVKPESGTGEYDGDVSSHFKDVHRSRETSEKHAMSPVITSEVHTSSPSLSSEVHTSSPSHTSEVHVSSPSLTSEVHVSSPLHTSEVHMSSPLHTSEVHMSSGSLTSEVHMSSPSLTSEVHMSSPSLTSEVHMSSGSLTSEVHTSFTGDTKTLSLSPDEVLSMTEPESSSISRVTNKSVIPDTETFSLTSDTKVRPVSGSATCSPSSVTDLPAMGSKNSPSPSDAKDITAHRPEVCSLPSNANVRPISGSETCSVSPVIDLSVHGSELCSSSTESCLLSPDTSDLSSHGSKANLSSAETKDLSISGPELCVLLSENNLSTRRSKSCSLPTDTKLSTPGTKPSLFPSDANDLSTHVSKSCSMPSSTKLSTLGSEPCLLPSIAIDLSSHWSEKKFLLSETKDFFTPGTETNLLSSETKDIFTPGTESSFLPSENSLSIHEAKPCLLPSDTNDLPSYGCPLSSVTKDLSTHLLSAETKALSRPRPEPHPLSSETKHFTLGSEPCVFPSDSNNDFSDSTTKTSSTTTSSSSITCSVCGKQLYSYSYLEGHMRTHTGEKPYSCPVCGRTFSLSQNLKKHSRIHTGEKRYHCPHCGKLFTDSQSMKRHTRIHTGEMPYQCSVCTSMKFRYREMYIQHMKDHSCHVAQGYKGRPRNSSLHKQVGVKTAVNAYCEDKPPVETDFRDLEKTEETVQSFLNVLSKEVVATVVAKNEDVIKPSPNVVVEKQEVSSDQNVADTSSLRENESEICGGGKKDSSLNKGTKINAKRKRKPVCDNLKKKVTLVNRRNFNCLRKTYTKCDLFPGIYGCRNEYSDTVKKSHSITGLQKSANIGSNMYPNDLNTNGFPDIGSMGQTNVHSLAHSDVGSITQTHNGSMTHNNTGSMTHSNTGSMTHNNTGSMTNNSIVSLAHSNTGSLAHGNNGSLTHSDTGSLTHSHTGSLAHGNTGSLTHTDPGSKEYAMSYLNMLNFMRQVKFQYWAAWQQQVLEGDLSAAVNLSVSKTQTSEYVNLSVSKAQTSESVNLSVPKAVNLSVSKAQTSESVNLSVSKAQTSESVNLSVPKAQTSESVNLSVSKAQTSESVNLSVSKAQTSESVNLSVSKAQTSESVNLSVSKAQISESVNLSVPKAQTSETVNLSVSEAQTSEAVISDVLTAKAHPVESNDKPGVLTDGGGVGININSVASTFYEQNESVGKTNLESQFGYTGMKKNGDKNRKLVKELKRKATSSIDCASDVDKERKGYMDSGQNFQALDLTVPSQTSVPVRDAHVSAVVSRPVCSNTKMISYDKYSMSTYYLPADEGSPGVPYSTDLDASNHDSANHVAKLYQADLKRVENSSTVTGKRVDESLTRETRKDLAENPVRLMEERFNEESISVAERLPKEIRKEFMASDDAVSRVKNEEQKYGFDLTRVKSEYQKEVSDFTVAALRIKEEPGMGLDYIDDPASFGLEDKSDTTEVYTDRAEDLIVAEVSSLNDGPAEKETSMFVSLCLNTNDDDSCGLSTEQDKMEPKVLQSDSGKSALDSILQNIKATVDLLSHSGESPARPAVLSKQTSVSVTSSSRSASSNTDVNRGDIAPFDMQRPTNKALVDTRDPESVFSQDGYSADKKGPSDATYCQNGLHSQDYQTSYNHQYSKDSDSYTDHKNVTDSSSNYDYFVKDSHGSNGQLEVDLRANNSDLPKDLSTSNNQIPNDFHTDNSDIPIDLRTSNHILKTPPVNHFQFPNHLERSSFNNIHRPKDLSANSIQIQNHSNSNNIYLPKDLPAKNIQNQKQSNSTNIHLPKGPHSNSTTQFEEDLNRFSVRQRRRPTSSQQVDLVACSLCGNRVKKSYLSTHLRNHRGYSCEFCGLMFKGRRYRNEHRRLHTGDNPYQCSVCGDTFLYKYKLSNHQLYEHPMMNDLSGVVAEASNQAKDSDVVPEGSAATTDSSVMSKVSHAAKNNGIVYNGSKKTNQNSMISEGLDNAIESSVAEVSYTAIKRSVSEVMENSVMSERSENRVDSDLISLGSSKAKKSKLGLECSKKAVSCDMMSEVLEESEEGDVILDYSYKAKNSSIIPGGPYKVTDRGMASNVTKKTTKRRMSENSVESIESSMMSNVTDKTIKRMMSESSYKVRENNVQEMQMSFSSSDMKNSCPQLNKFTMENNTDIDKATRYGTKQNSRDEVNSNPLKFYNFKDPGINRAHGFSDSIPSSGTNPQKSTDVGFRKKSRTKTIPLKSFTDSQDVPVSSTEIANGLDIQTQKYNSGGFPHIVSRETANCQDMPSFGCSSISSLTECDDDKSASIKKSLSHHQNYQDKPNLYCILCEKDFHSEERFDKHLIDHDGFIEKSESNICRECGEVFDCRSEFENHMNMHDQEGLS